jgi:hypothetical protein
MQLIMDIHHLLHTRSHLTDLHCTEYKRRQVCNVLWNTLELLHYNNFGLNVVWTGLCTGWSKSHVIHIKIFIDGCNSIQFDWINKHTMSLWLYKSPRRSRHVVTCSRQSVSCLQTVEVQGCLFSQVQRMFIVEHYLVSRSYLTCQNEFRDTFPDSPVPKKSTISRLVNRFLHCRNSSPGCIKHEEKSEYMHRWTRWTFATLIITLFFLFWFQCNLFIFLTNRTYARNGLLDFSITLYKADRDQN